MSTEKIGVVVIDDSNFMRRLICDILKKDEQLEVVGTAADGRQGMDLIMQKNPQVVITDLIMPDYDGLYVVKEVMEKKPLPIILLSSLEKTNSKVFDALAWGAFEFIDKPSGAESIGLADYPLAALVREATLADVSVFRKRHATRANNATHTFDEKLQYDVVVIGASTGGPGALEHILCNLPANLAIPVLVAQHMPARFLESFAERLNERTQLRVKIATKGEPVQPGIVYVAPGDANMKIENSLLNGKPMVSFTTKSFQEFNNPSVDCLMESVARIYGKKAFGVLLTGMGKDGAQGMKQIFDSGGYTVAQDEESAVVYGMPGTALQMGAVRNTVRLSDIPGFIISSL